MDMARERGESVAFTAFYAGNLAGLSELVLALARLGVARGRAGRRAALAAGHA